MSATPYQGTARPPPSQDAPSAAPAPGVRPTVNIPADTDADNVATRILQQHRTEADFKAWDAAAVRLCPPILPVSASSGYSAVSYSTSPAFGGTVTPSGDGATYNSRSGTNFVILCTLGGARGVAKFKVSTDGGATYGAEQTTAASLTDATTGITIAFSNSTFVLNATAQFHSANTPQAVWADSAGNFRHLVSANGFPMGRRTEFRENWVGCDASSTGKVPNYGHWKFITTAGSCAAESQALYSLIGFTAYPGVAELIVPGSTATVLLENLFSVTAAFNYTVLEAEFELGITPVGAGGANDWYAGFTSNTTAAWSTAKHSFALRKLHNAANWTLLTANGTTETSTDTTFSPTAGVLHRVKMELHGSATPIGVLAGSAIARVSIDGNPWITSVTTLPTSDMAFYFGSSITNGTDSMLMGSLLYSQNRYASLPTL